MTVEELLKSSNLPKETVDRELAHHTIQDAVHRAKVEAREKQKREILARYVAKRREIGGD